jgi:hypothetical protein
MTRDKSGGIALIAGAVGFIITMALHPTGRELLAPGRLAPVSRMVVGVHALALVSLPIAFFGTLILSRRLDAVGALIAYAFASVAVMNAAIFSGLLAPAIASRMSDSDTWRVAFSYNGMLNQAFAFVYVVASSAAIILWSIAILRRRTLPRGIGIAGCVLGPLILVVLFTHLIGLDVHGFGAIALGQSLWFIASGIALIAGADVSSEA